MAKKQKLMTQEELKNQPIPNQAVICNDPAKKEKNLKEAEEMFKRLQLKREIVWKQFNNKTFPFGEEKVLSTALLYLINHAKWDNIEIVRLKNTIKNVKKYLTDPKYKKGDLYFVNATFLESLQKFMSKDSGIGINDINDSAFEVDDWIMLSEHLNDAVLTAQPDVRIDQIWKYLTDVNNGPQKQPPLINGLYVTSLVDIVKTFVQAWENNNDYGKSIEEIIQGLIDFQIRGGNLPKDSRIESEQELKDILEKLDKKNEFDN